jgi:hypothetical protein
MCCTDVEARRLHGPSGGWLAYEGILEGRQIVSFQRDHLIRSHRLRKLRNIEASHRILRLFLPVLAHVAEVGCDCSGVGNMKGDSDPESARPSALRTDVPWQPALLALS